MISKSLRLAAPIVVGATLCFGVVAAQAAVSSHRSTTAPTSSIDTKIKPALETCSAGQHCTGMPRPKCTTEYVAVCHRHHASCQTVRKTVCS